MRKKGKWREKKVDNGQRSQTTYSQQLITITGNHASIEDDHNDQLTMTRWLVVCQWSRQLVGQDGDNDWSSIDVQDGRSITEGNNCQLVTDNHENQPFRVTTFGHRLPQRSVINNHNSRSLTFTTVDC